MRITLLALLHWLLVTAVLVLTVCYIGGEVIGWEHFSPFGGKGKLYRMASGALIVPLAGWLLVTFCLWAAAQDGEQSLEDIVLIGIGWFLLLITPVGIYVSHL